MFGESICLTLDYYFGEMPDHPLIYLGMASGMLAFRGLANREMLPMFLTGGKKEQPEKPVKTEIAPKTQSKKLTDKLNQQEKDRDAIKSTT